MLHLVLREAQVDVTALQHEVIRLRGLLTTLEAQSEQQRLVLDAFQKEQHKVALDAEVQTEDTRAGATVIALVIILYGFCRRVILSAFFGLLALDLAWIEETQGYAVTTLARSGDKSRELRRSHDTVRLLRSELKQQCEAL
eukprot:g29206.t1